MMAYFPSIGLAILIMAIAYIFFPIKYLGEKNEYVMFFLCSIGIFWIVYMCARIIGIKIFEMSEFHGWGFLYLWITITHLVFPFKRIKRNKNFTFLTVGFSIVALILYSCVMISLMMHDM